jgi:hypothetical protein
MGEWLANGENGFIPRHRVGWSKERAAEELAREVGFVAETIESLQRVPENMLSLAQDSLREAGLRHLAEPDSPDIVTSLRRAGRAALAACEMVSSGTGPVSVTLDDGVPILLDRIRDNALVDVSHFIDGFYAALAARDKDTLLSLSRLDVQRLGEPGVYSPEYRYHWARALQGFQLGATWTGKSLRAALEGAEPEALPFGAEYAAFIASIEMELMTATAADAGQFNAVLHRSLEGHQTFFGSIQPSPGEDLSEDPQGFIAFGPLAFAVCMADRGWPITVQSDYLPRRIILGQ